MFSLKKVHKIVPKHVVVAALMCVLVRTVHLVGVIDGVPVPVAARSKAWVYVRSPFGVAGSSAAGGMDACIL